MYRDGSDYDKMAILVGQIYIDYGIDYFPINPVSVCKKMGVNLIPYDELPDDKRTILKLKSMSGFYVPPTAKTPPMIFYNNDFNDVGSVGKMNRNILHEVKHYVCEDMDENPEDDDLADYFGKYFLSPIPYLIIKGIDNVNEIISTFNVDYTLASYIVKNVNNRKKKYGNKIFDYEKPLIKQLLGKDWFKEGGEVI